MSRKQIDNIMAKKRDKQIDKQQDTQHIIENLRLSNTNPTMNCSTCDLYYSF